MTDEQRTSPYTRKPSSSRPNAGRRISERASTARPVTARTITARTKTKPPSARASAARAAASLDGQERLEPALRQRLQSALLGWYSEGRRDLPWRSTRDPYCIWVSEIMLQQTRVQSVVAYYERWMRRFPSVHSLAGADTEEVLRAWEGLGYYSRARNLQRAAQQIVTEHGGRLPQAVEQLLALPGIGPYSAGAIASIAFDADEPVVDGNVIRVLTRLFGLPGNPRRGPLQGQLWKLAGQLIPAGRAGDFNQALMELGAMVCTPRSPRCSACPVAAQCRALQQDRVEAFPEAAERPALSDEWRAAAGVERRGRWLVVRAAPEALRWAGMWQFPDLKLAPGEDAAQLLPAAVAADTGVSIALGDRLCSLRHHVTRFRLQIDVYLASGIGGRARAGTPGAEVRWCSPEQLAGLAMPLCHRKIARALLAAAEAGAA